MRITHSDGDHLVVLSDAEAAVPVKASALLVVASQSVADAALPSSMAAVLGQLFDGLTVSTVMRHPKLVLRRQEIWPTLWGFNPGLLTP